ncbi:hypothetical protein [Mycobacterium conspicuum]|jgi:hypothetical protein|uniref:Uncharacterized protein n=1 Tax=Mycobacterium conspicuum TaxID=44010 RepID=A0A1X1T2B1_9MYCO|nr:hypothetical protein [Mycobacterium conspicuum]ORV38432.1 hypothetical protein AWC00_20155 [Mycobacterium conspicuum]BBZ39748.1 hypothetical protein MCNS_28110 [Mycobacterium conspicuum]
MTGTKKIAMFGGAAALAFVVGFGGTDSLGNSPTTQPAPPAASAPAHAPSNVHNATLVACISGLNPC